MEPINFEEHKEAIAEALKEKLKNPVINSVEKNGFTLIDGFIMQPIDNEISKNIKIGGNKQIPLVGVIGNTTGKVHYFAAKVLLPELF